MLRDAPLPRHTCLQGVPRRDNGWDITASFDLDGDGRAEMVTSVLGAYILWRADGKQIGVVGGSLG